MTDQYQESLGRYQSQIESDEIKIKELNNTVKKLKDELILSRNKNSLLKHELMAMVKVNGNLSTTMTALCSSIQDVFRETNCYLDEQ